MKGADLCSTGKEQSPIDLSTREFNLSDKMELNGYGYLDFAAKRNQIEAKDLQVKVNDGEFILNLFDGRKQLFKPI